MPGGVDLHTHTTASDGTYAPRELVAEASDRGVRVLAITDHDSTEGLAEALEEAERRRPLEIVPVIAHPGLADRDALIPGLIAAGLMGIECYYTEHSAAQRASYLQLCKDHDLAATGGSDFHGPKVRAATLGSPAVPMSAVDALRAKAAASRAALG